MKKKVTPKKKEELFASSDVMSLLEQMNDGIAIIAETQQETNQKLDEMNGRLTRVEDDVLEIKHRLSEKVDRDEFNKMEKRMVKLEKLVFAKLG